MLESGFKISEKAAEKTQKHSIGGHLAVSVGNVLLAASGPLTIRKIAEGLQAEGYYNVCRNSIAKALSDIACDKCRVLEITLVPVGPRRKPTSAYQLTQKSKPGQ